MDATRLINANTNAYSAPARSAGQDVDPHHGVKEKFVPTGGTLVSQETLQPKAAAPASAVSASVPVPVTASFSACQLASGRPAASASIPAASR